MRLVHIADRNGVSHQKSEIVIALAPGTDETDSNKLARVLAGGGASAIQKNVWSDETKAGDQSGAPASAKKFAARKGGRCWHKKSLPSSRICCQCCSVTRAAVPRGGLP